MKNAGLNAADFSRASNMAESVVSRTLSGKTVPTFNKVDAAARTLGYELTLSPLERVTVRVIGPAMSDLMQSIQQYSGTEEQWTRVSAGMRNLMEFHDDEPADFKKVTKGMDVRWQAFMAGLYDYQHWSKGDVSPQSLKLDAEWTPLRKIYRSATPPDEFFAWYNVIIPRGELLWK